MINQPLPHNLLQRFSQPSGQKPPTVLILGLWGWNDAADTVQGALSSIKGHFAFKTLEDSLDTAPFYSYTDNQPYLSVNEAGLTELIWPQLKLAETFTPTGLRLLTLNGPEPNLNWPQLAQAIFQLIKDQGVDLVLLCGALLDEVPHTRPLPLTISSWSPSLQALEGVEPNKYSGPTGLIGTLAHLAGEADIPALSLWVSVPHYLPDSPHPKASLALLQALEVLLECPMPTATLQAEISSWEQTAADLLDDEPELAHYVRTLESIAEAKEDIGDLSQLDIAAAFERFLKDQDPQ